MDYGLTLQAWKGLIADGVFCSGSAPARTRLQPVLRDVERERSAVSGEEYVLSHHAFERLAIDARHGRRLKILPR